MNPKLKKYTAFFCVTVLLTVISCSSPQKERTINFEDSSWTSQIQNEHPRLFFNKQTFKSVRERALNEERELFDDMKARVDSLFGQEIVFKDPLVADGTQNLDHEYGTRAAEAAFVYLVTKDKSKKRIFMTFI